MSYIYQIFLNYQIVGEKEKEKTKESHFLESFNYIQQFSSEKVNLFWKYQCSVVKTCNFEDFGRNLYRWSTLNVPLLAL